MCDPVSLSIVSTVVGAAGGIFNAVGASNAQKKQKQEYENWIANQRQMRAAENQRQETLSQEAKAAQQAGLAKVGAEAQQKTQSDEQARLTKQLTQDAGASAAQNPATSVADKTLLAPDNSAQAVADTGYKNDLAKKMSEAAGSVRQRLAALANVQSYGGSYGGLGTVIPEALGRSGTGIDIANNLRRGSLAAYGVEKSVDPVQVTYTPSPIADIFANALSFGAQGLGHIAGSSTFPSAPTYGNNFVGPAAPLPPYLQNTQGIF